MQLLKATLVTLVSAALSVPSVAQTVAAPSSVPPNKASVAAGKVATTTPSKASPKVAPSVQPSPPSRAKAKKVARKKAPEPPHAQLPPPPPPTPAQLPPNPARVTMRNGLLTIDANNSTLADVLTGVRRETKAAIDLPAGASGERVVANLGPGTPQNVLTALLNGSRFDYIILGSQDQPDTVQRVILRAKSGPEPAPTGGPIVAQRAPNPNGVNVQPVQPEESDEGTPAEEIPDENNPQPQQQEIDGEQQQGQPNQQQQQPGVKTPEQLLEELRQMQQQQQENQQQPQQQQQQSPQPLYQQQQPQQPSPDEQ